MAFLNGSKPAVQPAPAGTLEAAIDAMSAAAEAPTTTQPAAPVKDVGPKLVDGPFTVTPLIGGSWLLQHGDADTWGKKDNDQTKTQRAFTSNRDLVEFIARQLNVDIRRQVAKPVDHPPATDQRALMARLLNRKPLPVPNIPGPAPGQAAKSRGRFW